MSIISTNNSLNSVALATTRDAYSIMAKKIIEQYHLTDLGVDEGVGKWFLSKFGEMVRIGLVWLRIKCNGELL